MLRLAALLLRCWNDRSRVTGPIALAEVQGYGCAAVVDAAAIHGAFGRAGSAEWRDYAGDLAGKFRVPFCCSGHLGPYPAIALTAAKRAASGARKRWLDTKVRLVCLLRYGRWPQSTSRHLSR
ncbi:hypothetical protein RCH17_001246 [Arthrobacter sp. MP_M7]|nr:hypothetical protein [Arthrobacter sp. MP_M4]MEC5202450.1 hypothetical protein [Arthrobacter sp. MP_M7]